MKSIAYVVFTSLLICACNGKSNNHTSIPASPIPPVRDKLTDTDIWRNNLCNYGTLNIDYIHNPEELFVDEITSISCYLGRETYDDIDYSSVTDSMSITEDIGLFYNLTTLELSTPEYDCCPTVGSLNNLSKAEKLETLILNVPFDQESTAVELWGNLKLKKLSTTSTIKGIGKATTLEELRIDLNDTAEVEEISTLANLKTLHLKAGDLAGVNTLSSLTSLEDLFIEFGDSAYIDSSFIGELDNLKTLHFGIYKDEIGDLGIGQYSDSDLYVKNFNALAASLTELEELSFYGLSLTSFHIIQNLDSLSKLSIDLDYNFDAPQDIESLICGSNLTELQLSAEGWLTPNHLRLTESQLDPSCWGASNL